MGTLSGEATLLYFFLPPISLGATLKEKNAPLRGEILSFKRRPYSERAVLARKADRKSQKLSPFEKWWTLYGGVPIHQNNKIITGFCFDGHEVLLNSEQVIMTSASNLSV